MSRDLHSELIVSVTEIVNRSGNVVVIPLIETAVIREEQESLFGDQVVEFKFSELDVEPGAPLDVVKANEGGLEVPRSVLVRRRQENERYSFVERPGRPQVHPGKIKSVLLHRARDERRTRSTAGNRVDRQIICALSMPVRRYTKCDWKVARVLPDGRVALVAQLIAIVAKHLPEVIQLRPRVMTCRTRQSILSREGRDCSNVETRQRRGLRRGGVSIERRQ